jgi:anti-anti-sigma factor
VDTDTLEISVVMRRRPGELRIELTGDVDQFGAVGLRRALDDAVGEHPDRIEVDLSGATLFCSAAATALMNAREASAGRLVLVAAAPVVRKVLRLVGLAETFPNADGGVPA